MLSYLFLLIASFVFILWLSYKSKKTFTLLFTSFLLFFLHSMLNFCGLFLGENYNRPHIFRIACLFTVLVVIPLLFNMIARLIKTKFHP